MEATIPSSAKLTVSSKPTLQFFTVKQAIDGNYFPFKAQTLRNLLYAGEKQKKGILPAGKDYILWLNVGSIAQPKWTVEPCELEAWVRRKAKVNH